MSYSRRARIDTSAKRSKVFGVPMIGCAISAANPWRSVGLACASHQTSEFNQFYQDNGISGAHHDTDGTFVAESRKARNDVLKLRNMRDNDASYGDWSGTN
jgi:hypothetical protein